MEAKELKIEYLPTDQLTPYENNANIHTDLQVDQIVKSIEEFGFNDALAIWDDKDGNHILVEGHGRLLAAKKLGMKELPVIRLNDLTDEQRRAYTHVHNQLTRNSKFDTDMLKADIELLPFDWEALGFDPIDLIDMKGDEYEFDDEDDIDEFADLAEENLPSYNVIISCLTEEEQEGIKELLGVPADERLKRMYKAEELLNERI